MRQVLVVVWIAEAVQHRVIRCHCVMSRVLPTGELVDGIVVVVHVPRCRSVRRHRREVVTRHVQVVFIPETRCIAFKCLLMLPLRCWFWARKTLRRSIAGGLGCDWRRALDNKWQQWCLVEDGALSETLESSVAMRHP